MNTAWTTLFDVTSEPYRWGGSGEGLAAIALLVLGGAVAFALRRRHRRGGPAVLVAAVLLAALLVRHALEHRAEHAACVGALQRGEGVVLEGPVTSFRPLRSVWQRPAYETFEVAGTPVKLPLFAEGCGYHRTVVEGGPFRDGVRVRLRVWNGEVLSVQLERESPALKASGAGAAP